MKKTGNVAPGSNVVPPLYVLVPVGINRPPEPAANAVRLLEPVRSVETVSVPPPPPKRSVPPTGASVPEYVGLVVASAPRLSLARFEKSRLSELLPLRATVPTDAPLIKGRRLAVKAP